MMGRRAACTGRLEEASRGFPTNYAGLDRVARRPPLVWRSNSFLVERSSRSSIGGAPRKIVSGRCHGLSEAALAAAAGPLASPPSRRGQTDFSSI